MGLILLPGSRRHILLLAMLRCLALVLLLLLAQLLLCAQLFGSLPGLFCSLPLLLQSVCGWRGGLLLLPFLPMRLLHARACLFVCIKVS